MRRLMTACGLAVMTLLVAGCAGTSVSPGAAPAAPATSATSETASSTSGPTVPDSADTAVEPAGAYTATSTVGHDIVPGSTIEIEFTDGTIGVRAGCNSMGGTFTVDGGRLVLDGLFQTEKGCEQALMDQDAWLVAFLSSSPSVTVTGETVTLSGSGVVTETIELSRSATPTTASIFDTGWQLDTIVRGDIASSVPAGVTPTVTISDGRIAIDAQCNSVGGTAVVEDGDLTVTEVISTMMACEDARGEMEKLLVTVFDGTVPYTVDRDRLTVTGADGTRLVFVAGGAGVSPTSGSEPAVSVSPVTPTMPSPPTS